MYSIEDELVWEMKVSNMYRKLHREDRNEIRLLESHNFDLRSKLSDLRRELDEIRSTTPEQ